MCVEKSKDPVRLKADTTYDTCVVSGFSQTEKCSVRL
jgi:hypothetical protein